jgi:poly(hydroxyalkanoate) depolymerase family esterase
MTQHSIRRKTVSKTVAIIRLAVLSIVFSGLFMFPIQAGAMGTKPKHGFLLQEIENFGDNPGNLKMFAYIPADVGDDAPLVAALHGCTQNAAEYAHLTQWNELADQLKFYVIYPEQKRVNNMNLCFNWFSLADIEKDRGEALSIKQMVDRMVSDYSIDQKRIYVTGLSAGGYMTSAVLATYPEVFAGGAIMAGGPYRCATTVVEAISECMPGKVNKTPEQWGLLVRNASNISEEYPILSIFHGDQDETVRDTNMDELVEQWTNVHQADQIPEVDEQFRGHGHKIYHDKNGKAIVEIYHLHSMGHAITVDPGNKADHGGNPGKYSKDMNIYSSFYAARFWGLSP